MNSWRERLPNKYEDVTTFKYITEQRNFILNGINLKMKEDLEKLDEHYNVGGERLNSSKIQ